MSRFALIRRPAIPGPSSVAIGPITLEALSEATVLQILTQPAASGRPRLDDDFDLRPAGPGQWFAIASGAISEDRLASLMDGLRPAVTVVDQSHGRCLLRVSGGPVRAVLAKGTGIDLGGDAFPIGHATMTLIGPIGVQMARTGTDVFELLVLRSFAAQLFDDLREMSRAFSTT